jgi:hypothetical protein
MRTDNTSEQMFEREVTPSDFMRLAFGRCQQPNPNPLTHVTDGTCTRHAGHDGPHTWQPASCDEPEPTS